MAQAQLRQTDSRSLRSAIEAGFRHRRLFLGLVGIVLLLAILITAVSRRQYRSEMKLLIQNARSNSVISADRSATPSSGDVTEQEINSEIEVLQSQDVLSAVADPSWDLANTAPRTSQQMKDHELRVTTLSKRLQIEAVRKSNIIQIGLLATTPQAAAETLRSLSVAYMAERKKLSRPGGATDFYAEETNQYLNQWQNAHQALISFQQEHHLVSVPELENGIKMELDGIGTQLQTATTALAESDRKLQEVDTALRRVPERQPTQQRTIANQLSIQQMQTLRLQLGNKRTEMTTRYKPTDRLVIELDQEIADTEAALKRATDQKGQEDTTDVSPVWQQLRVDSSMERVNHGALLGRIASLKNSQLQLQAKLSDAQQLAVQYDNLRSRSEQAQNNYKTFSEKHDQAQIEDAMDEHKLVNVAVAESPTSSYRPFSPRPLQNLLLAMVSALFLGCGAVYFAELARSTVSNAHELETYSQQNVLASIPYDSFPARASSYGTTAVMEGTGAGQQGRRSMVHAVQSAQGVARSILGRF